MVDMPFNKKKTPKTKKSNFDRLLRNGFVWFGFYGLSTIVGH